MATKINGSTGWPIASNKPNFTSDENGGIPATLVIHDGPHERVFTEAEVKAMLDAALGRMAVYKANGSEILRAVAKQHGIVLDP